jgi:predicted MPP superfamily phosphohydrolase
MISFIFISFILLAVAVSLVFFLLSFFFLAGHVGQVIIFSSLLVISFGFLSVLFLSRSFNNRSLRVGYRFFCLAVGFLFYLTLAALVVGLLKIIFPDWPIHYLATGGLILAVVLTIVGLAEALVPQLKQISLSLPQWPENWHHRRLIQLSDVHLGNFYGPHFLRQQIDRINLLKPDLIVITGDLFDGTALDLAPYTTELKRIKAKQGVYFIFGNHDIYLGVDRVSQALQSAGIVVLRDEALLIDRLPIVGLTFRESDKIPLPSIKNGSEISYRGGLLLRHAPVGIAWAVQQGFALQLSGHSHRGQMFPLALLTRFIFGRYHYGWHHAGNFNIYTSSGVGSWGPPLRTFNRPEIVVIDVI